MLSGWKDGKFAHFDCFTLPNICENTEFSKTESKRNPRKLSLFIYFHLNSSSENLIFHAVSRLTFTGSYKKNL